VVVEPHSLFKRLPGLSLRPERTVHLVLLLQNPVDPFRHSVFVAMHDLGHADRQTSVLQSLNIGMAAVLTPSIRVMNRVLPFRQLAQQAHAEASEDLREQVIRARKIQLRRFEAVAHLSCNSRMGTALRNSYCALDREGASLIRLAMEQLGFSARAYDRILKVARTIADLDGSEKIQAYHLSEALNDRNLDREGWSG
jgi:hypothetical protein